LLLRDNLHDALRDAILTCEFQPGQELREQDLAARFSVSRSPVRDALLRLERERLVTVQPRQGYRVSRVSLADARDIFDMRLLIEPACAAAAAKAGNTEALEAFRERGDEDFVAYNRAFHGAIADLSGNARMAATARELVEQSDRLVRVSLAATGAPDEDKLFDEHGAIIVAIRTGASREAARIMRAHVDSARTRVLSALKTTQTGSKPHDGG
jgi:DNA-binding GntR family transcriptional regulator